MQSIIMFKPINKLWQIVEFGDQQNFRFTYLSMEVDALS